MRALILDSRPDVLAGYRNLLPGWTITPASKEEVGALIRTRHYDAIFIGTDAPILTDCPACARRPVWILHAESFDATLPQIRVLGATRALFRIWPRAWEDPDLPEKIQTLTGQRTANR